MLTTRARWRLLWPRSAPVLAAYATLQACILPVYLITGGGLRHLCHRGARKADAEGDRVPGQRRRATCQHTVRHDARGPDCAPLKKAERLNEWTHTYTSTATVLGLTLPVPDSLIHLTLFLGALTFMYISARAADDAEYRSTFLDPLIDDLRTTLTARNRYRGARRAGRG